MALAVTLGLAAGCASGSAGSDFTPAPHATRNAPQIKADPLPPLSKFVIQADGSQVSTVSADYLFDSNSSTLLPQSVTTLSQIVPAIREHAGRIAVVGFTDGVGRPEDNQKLSLDRAKAVEAWLATQNIPSSVLDVEGRGEQGARDGVADASRRRVEIVLR